MKPIILCMGLPGSGKTTSSGKLKLNLKDYIVVCLPDIKEKLGIDPFDRSEETKKVINKYLNNIKEEVKKGKSLILDRAALRISKREECYSLAKELNKEILVINHSVSEETAKERLKERPIQNRDDFSKNPELFDNYVKKITDPRKDNLSKYPHVSLIIFNTEDSEFELFKINKRIKPFVDRIINILQS